MLFIYLECYLLFLFIIIIHHLFNVSRILPLYDISNHFAYL